MEFERAAFVDSTAHAQPKVPAVAWLRRAAIACGALVAMVWSSAVSSDPIADAFSLVAQERYAEAHEALEPMLERAPETPGVRLLHGVVLAREGNLAEAITLFESLRNDHPTMFEAHNNLAVLYARVGRLDDARDALVAALELKSDAVVYANLGDVYMKLAERAYQRAHELRDQIPPALDESEQAAASPEPEKAPDDVASADVATDAAQALATDLPEPPEPESPAQPEEPPVVQATSATCVRVGWFQEPVAADEAAAWMRSAGAEAVRVRPEEQQVINSYQVYLPPASSREAAVAMAREMKEKGIADIWIIDRGALTNGISLGVFRSKSNMSRRVAEMEKLGYPVTSTAHMKSVTEYAVEARAGGDHFAFDDTWNARFRDFTVRRVDCADLN